MEKSFQVTPDVEIIPSYFPIPNMGFLAVNAFLVKAKEPVLVDTGMGIEGEKFMSALSSLIEIQDLRWIWITHDDADHTGNLRRILERAPKARLVANALAVLRMSTAWPIPMQRVYWLNSGESISVGDRKLTAIRPPLFDNPTTIGVYDEKSEVFFSSDCFGAILPSPAKDADEVAKNDLVQGIISWGSVDCPWIHMVDPGEFSRVRERLQRIAPKVILSAHLPPAKGRTGEFLDLLAKIPASSPFVAPNQTMLEQILAAES